MRQQVMYEWCYETIDEYGDILEVDFEDRLSDFQDNRKTNTLALVRREGDEYNGESDRLWAYVKDGKLPETFSDESGNPIAIYIPKRFYKELSKHY